MAITKTGMPLNKHAPTHQNPQVMQFTFVVGINFHRKAVIRNLLSKRKASLQISKNKFPSKITCYTGNTKHAYRKTV